MISTKQRMYHLYHSGAFGNRLRTWSSLRDLVESDYNDFVTLRTCDVGGGFTHYSIPAHDALWTVKVAGVDPRKVVANESAPDEQLLWQGELSRLSGCLYLRYATEKAKMRVAMQHATCLSGMVVQQLLLRTLTPASYDDVQELLELYPDDVIELSVYEMPLGDCRHRNAVIWEVRAY